jgi:hypothetical protein
MRAHRGTGSRIHSPPAGSQANVWTASAPSAMAIYRFLTLVRAAARPATTGEAGGLIRCHRDLGVEAMKVVSPGETWSLNCRLTTPIGGGPATARLTRRKDRSAQLGRGPKTLVIGRQRTIGSLLNGSAASAVYPDRSSRVTKSRSSTNIMGRFRRSMCRRVLTADQGLIADRRGVTPRHSIKMRLARLAKLLSSLNASMARDRMSDRRPRRHSGQVDRVGRLRAR